MLPGPAWLFVQLHIVEVEIQDAVIFEDNVVAADGMEGVLVILIAGRAMFIESYWYWKRESE